MDKEIISQKLSANNKHIITTENKRNECIKNQNQANSHKVMCNWFVGLGALSMCASVALFFLNIVAGFITLCVGGIGMHICQALSGKYEKDAKDNLFFVKKYNREIDDLKKERAKILKEASSEFIQDNNTISKEKDLPIFTELNSNSSSKDKNDEFIM